MEARPGGCEELTVAIASLEALDEREAAAVASLCRRANLCFYRTAQTAGAAEVSRLGRRLGLGRAVANPLADEENISHIKEMPNARYIPYSNAALKWHTDGYYNDPQHSIGSFIMHCAQPAAAGGENCYFDPELAYILLRDDNPGHIEALTHPQAMTIPANDDEGGVRPVCCGPVFAADAGGNLLMRYTDRKRHVRWHKNCLAAVECLRELLDGNEEYRIVKRLEKGEGVICNNVLHNREPFAAGGGPARLLYRARYHRRLPQTDWHQLCGMTAC